MHYDLALLGATMASLSIARALPTRRILILESTELVVPEFTTSYRLPGEYSNAPRYCEAFAALSADIHLNASVLGIEPCAEGYRLRIFGMSGHLSVTAGTVIDTTCSGVAVSRRLCAVVSGPTPLPGETIEGLGIEDDSADGQYLALLRLPWDNSPLNLARRELCRLWEARSASFAEWRLIAVAPCFDERPAEGDQELAPGHYRFPSALYDTPAACSQAAATWLEVICV